jgi:hypothetical protein
LQVAPEASDWPLVQPTVTEGAAQASMQACNAAPALPLQAMMQFAQIGSVVIMLITAACWFAAVTTPMTCVYVHAAAVEYWSGTVFALSRTVHGEAKQTMFGRAMITVRSHVYLVVPLIVAGSW